MRGRCASGVIWGSEQVRRRMWESGDQDWWESLRTSGGQVENGRSGKFLRKA